MKIKIYQPICSSKSSKNWFTVNGAISEDREEAIRKAMQHVGVKDGAGKIERIDEHLIDEDDWNRPNIY